MQGGCSKRRRGGRQVLRVDNATDEFRFLGSSLELRTWCQ